MANPLRRVLLKLVYLSPDARQKPFAYQVGHQIPGRGLARGRIGPGNNAGICPCMGPRGIWARAWGHAAGLSLGCVRPSNQWLPARLENQRWHRTPSRHGSARSTPLFALYHRPSPARSASCAPHGNGLASFEPGGQRTGIVGSQARPPAARPAVQSPGFRGRAAADLPSRPVCAEAGAGGSAVWPR